MKKRFAQFFRFKILNAAAFIANYDADKVKYEILQAMNELKADLELEYAQYADALKADYTEQAVKHAEQFTNLPAAQLKRKIAVNLAHKASVQSKIISINDVYEQANKTHLKAAQATARAGVNNIKKWVSQFDGRVRRTHDMVNHQAREVADDFDVPSPYGGSETAQSPKDSNLSPANRRNCRCYMETEIV